MLNVTTALASIRSMPMADYLALDACSSSRLRNLGRSPAYCRYMIDHPAPATDAMRLGSLVDCLLTEPASEGARFAVKDYDARTKEGKARRDLLAESGLTVLDADDYHRARTIAASVRLHPFWGALKDARYQQTVYVEGSPGRKARPDILATYGTGLAVVDIKVCRQASQDIYPRACWGLWHPQQLAWYADCLRLAGENVVSSWTLAVHPQEPHEVTAYQMSDAMMKVALEVVLRREEKYADCVASGVWPDGDELVVVEPPEWTMPDEVQTEEE